MTIDVAIGRWLAICAHPRAAWRMLPPSGKLLLAASYFATTYASVLAALLMM